MNILQLPRLWQGWAAEGRGRCSYKCFIMYEPIGNHRGAFVPFTPEAMSSSPPAGARLEAGQTDNPAGLHDKKPLPVAQAAQSLPSCGCQREQETPGLGADVCGDAKAFYMGVPTLENSAAPRPEGMSFPREDGWRQAGGKQGWKGPGCFPTCSLLGPASCRDQAGIVPPSWGEGKGTANNHCPLGRTPLHPGAG